MESLFDVTRSIVQKADIQAFNNRNNQLFIKRDDLIDADVSGNKWRKLKYTFEQALKGYKNSILTFGGAFSNHLLATAKAGYMYQLPTIGIVRGEELMSSSNELLEKCSALGMELVFVSREEYSRKNDRTYLEELYVRFPNACIVPEGGANYLGVVGCQEIMAGIENSFDHIFVAQGTTTTSIGIAMSLNSACRLHVVPVLKGFDSISEMRYKMLSFGMDASYCDEILSCIDVHADAHYGGYAKYTKELLDGMEQFYLETGIPLDHVYTGKVAVEIMRWLKASTIENQRILMIHTGGISGGNAVRMREKRRYA